MHGQKGVVTILDNAHMPMISGRTAAIVIVSSSIMKRGTVSKLLEAACGIYTYRHMSGVSSHRIGDGLHSYECDFNVRHSVHSFILTHYEGDFVMSGHGTMKNVTMPNDETVQPMCVRANYGIIRLMQSCFLASLRMSCTSRSAGPHTFVPNNRSSQGGSKSLGEMECMQLVASGMSSCMQEVGPTCALWTCLEDVDCY